MRTASTWFEAKLDRVLAEADKMSAIDLQKYYQQHANNKEWLQILSKFPEDLQREIIDERGEGNAEEIADLKRYTLKRNAPTNVNLRDLLKNKDNLETLGRVPQEILNIINQKWGTNAKTVKVYEQNPNRLLEYAKMDPATAKPSVMFDGEIGWGVGRFVAALIRGDKTMPVWDLRAN